MRNYVVSIFRNARIVTVLFLTPVVHSALDAETLALQHDPGLYPLVFEQVKIFHDTAETYDIQKILTEQDKFLPNRQETPNFGFGTGAYWIRIDVVNQAENEAWFMEVAYPMIDSIRVFIVNPATGMVLTRKEFGDSLPFARREVPHRNFIFHLPLEDRQPRRIFLRVQSRGSIVLPMTLAIRGRLADRDYLEQGFIWFFYGILAVMILYNLMLAITLKDSGYFYYIFYMGFIGVYLLGLNGLAYQFFWPGSPWWNQRSVVLGLVLGTLFGLRFAQTFLNTRENAPAVHLILHILVIGMAANLIFTFFDTVRASKVQALLIIIQYAISLTTGLLLFFRGFKPARYFSIAFTVLIASVFIHTFRIFGILPGTFLTFNAIQIGIAIEMLLLSLALADRIKILKDDREKSQRETIEQRTMMVRAASRFVPRPFLNYLGHESIVDAQLGDQIEKELSILFTDIRDFTALSEGMTPQENFNFINSILRRVGPIIREHNGFIDKYLGDAVMALFPHRPEDAISAGIQIRRILREFNLDREQRNLVPIDMGIGINTGSAILGTIGELERMETTVISDAVNLASRIEGLTKTYGAAMVISEQTLNRLEDPAIYAIRVLDRVKVKGKREPVSVFEILNSYPEDLSALKGSTKSDFEEGISYYQKNDFRRSAELFRAVLAVDENDTAAELYLNRCEYFIANGVPPDWEGTWQMENK